MSGDGGLAPAITHLVANLREALAGHGRRRRAALRVFVLPGVAVVLSNALAIAGV